MHNKVIDFPQYRKLSNNKVFYRIVSNVVFEEIQIIGNKALLHQIEAIQYPEMIRIKDMLELNGYEMSTESEFLKLINDYSLC